MWRLVLTGILLVDDSLAVRTQLRALIARAGLRGPIREASTVAQASRLAAEDAPDVVFLDLTLPDGSGRMLMPQLGFLSSVRIVLVTGRSRDDPDVQRALRLGARAYLPKPLRYDAFVRACEDAGVRAERTAPFEIPAPTAEDPDRGVQRP